MAHKAVGPLALILMLAMGFSAQGQATGTRAPESSDGDAAAGLTAPDAGSDGAAPLPSEPVPGSPEKSLFDRVSQMLSQTDDPDGPINTDRPTFTPANTVVPRGRLQFESGFTFNAQRLATARTTAYDYPELSSRFGLYDRVEFRTFWTGEDDIQTQPRRRRGRSTGGGLSDMEVGFKWQLLVGNAQRKWIPTTALITSVTVPTAGGSPLSSQTVEPYINLIYGWSATDKLTLAGSTGYLGLRQQPAPGSGRPAENFQRWHQSLVGFYSATDRTTLFYEWYVFMFTNAADNRPTHFMDGGVLYCLTPNIQLDLRAGFGLSGRPDDFFTGAGLSVRF